MNHDTHRRALPPLVGTVLTNGCHYIDNLLAGAWKTLHLNQLLLRAGFSKRHGIEVTETVFVLMVWRWLNVSSVAMFCRTALGLFSRAKKDVLYDFLKREDVDWRKFNLDTAKEAGTEHAVSSRYRPLGASCPALHRAGFIRVQATRLSASISDSIVSARYRSPPPARSM